MNRAERRRMERQKSEPQVSYRYTAEQIEQIKRQAVRDKEKELDAHVKRVVQKEWDERAEILKGETADEMMKTVLALLLAVPARVLCEHFGWGEVKHENDDRSRLKRFSELVVTEVNRICDDEAADIRRYAEETAKKCGVKYLLEDE